MTDEQRSALLWHLTNNIFPSQELAIDLAEEAINACNDGEWHKDIVLPNNHGTVTSGDVVEDLQLHYFIEEPEYETGE